MGWGTLFSGPASEKCVYLVKPQLQHTLCAEAVVQQGIHVFLKPSPKRFVTLSNPAFESVSISKPAAEDRPGFDHRKQTSVPRYRVYLAVCTRFEME